MRQRACTDPSKVAIITGGSEGLGKAAALKLAAEGARVAIVARRPGPLQALAEELKLVSGIEPLTMVCDVTNAPDCSASVDSKPWRYLLVPHDDIAFGFIVERPSWH